MNEQEEAFLVDARIATRLAIMKATEQSREYYVRDDGDLVILVKAVVDKQPINSIECVFHVVKT